MADIEKTGSIFRVLAAISPVTWNKISFWGRASDVQFNDNTTAESKLGKITGITSDVNSVSETLCSSAYLNNYTIGEKTVFSLPVAGWSAGTVTIGGKAYHTQEFTVSKILLAHPLMYLSIDSIPSDALKEIWAQLEMIANTSTKKITFYIETVPSVALSIGVKGVVK